MVELGVEDIYYFNFCLWLLKLLTMLYIIFEDKTKKWW